MGVAFEKLLDITTKTHTIFLSNSYYMKHVFSVHLVLNASEFKFCMHAQTGHVATNF